MSFFTYIRGHLQGLGIGVQDLGLVRGQTQPVNVTRRDRMARGSINPCEGAIMLGATRLVPQVGLNGNGGALAPSMLLQPLSQQNNSRGNIGS